MYILPPLANCHFVIASFYLCTSRAYDVFALVINFWAMIGNQNMWHWFEAIQTTSQALAKNLTKLLKKYGLRKKIIAYVKDKGSNINVMTIALKLVVSCESLSLEENF
jgi:hypothetical protein